MVIDTKIYEAPPFDREEILRYAGVKMVSSKGKNKEDEIISCVEEGIKAELECSLDKLIESCIEEVHGKLVYKVCFGEFSIFDCEECLDLGFAKTNSKDLRKNLKNCDSIILFGATIGMDIDRLIARYSKVSPVRALMFQAIGAERIERLCNMFNKEIKEQIEQRGMHTKPRFSPGYGDLPLEMQTEIFQVLDCARKIGLTLNKSLLMSPSKSVTAIIGITSVTNAISEEMKHHQISNCKICQKKNCAYRRNE